MCGCDGVGEEGLLAQAFNNRLPENAAVHFSQWRRDTFMNQLSEIIHPMQPECSGSLKNDWVKTIVVPKWLERIQTNFQAACGCFRVFLLPKWAQENTRHRQNAQ